MVNRIWQHHFGQGLVATSDNFGERGERPSHPELLDWLATRFVESGWSMKAMHRLMCLSATYQQSSQSSEVGARNAELNAGVPHSALRIPTLADPGNRLLSHFQRRRLSAEELRDAVLVASGKLDREPGADEGSAVVWDLADRLDDKRGFRTNAMPASHPLYTDFTKRSIYLPVVRNLLPDVLALFDAADPNGVTTLRNDTTVPSQSLFLLNSPLLRKQSLHFAQRLLADEKATDAQRLQRAHELAFGRQPEPDELAQGHTFLDAYFTAPETRTRPQHEWRLTTWQSYCQALLCQNEFIYLE